MKVLLVGAGGYGTEYVKRLLVSDNPDITFVGIVDPYFATCPKREDIVNANIPVYDTMEGFYSKHTADFAIICTPPFLHMEQSICALKHGSYVLCEKPVAPTLAEAEKMEQAEKEYGKWIAIGYQWSFSDAITELKKDILEGKLGKSVSLKTMISWPRNRAYYARGGGWGGKLELNGKPLLDSIASNACAHYLHNMLFVLGSKMNESTTVSEIKGNCLKANDIENFDTCSLRLTTREGAKLYYVASHAAKEVRNPVFEYTFENATVSFSEDEGSVKTAKFADGSQKVYGNPFADAFEKIGICVDAIKKGTTPICTVRTAMPHTELIERIWKEIPIEAFSNDDICENDKNDGVYVKNLFETMVKAYDECKLLSEVV